MTVAIVTGATRGVGKGVAVALGRTGATVYCTGRSTGGKPTFPSLGGTAEETAALVSASGGTGIALVCDHRADDSVRAAFDRVRNEQEAVDVLVNNVWGGYEPYHRGDYHEMSAPFWEQPVSVWDGMSKPGCGLITWRAASPCHSWLPPGA